MYFPTFNKGNCKQRFSTRCLHAKFLSVCERRAKSFLKDAEGIRTCLVLLHQEIHPNSQRTELDHGLFAHLHIPCVSPFICLCPIPIHSLFVRLVVCLQFILETPTWGHSHFPFSSISSINHERNLLRRPEESQWSFAVFACPSLALPATRHCQDLQSKPM